jgi:TetR/AcrR family transcriptional regulator, regulator of mycofactocin system
MERKIAISAFLRFVHACRICDMTHEVTGLRERKRQRTREAIVDAALRLFDERGFDHTTIADIAAEADIAPRTFFGYFPSKDAVVFDEFDDTFAALKARLLDRREGETAIDAMRDWLAGFLASHDHEDERSRCRRRVVASTAALQDHERGLMGRFEEILGDAVAIDLDEEPGSLRPRLVAAAAVAALTSLDAEHEHGGARGLKSRADPMATIDEALAFVRAGVAELQARPRPPQS